MNFAEPGVHPTKMYEHEWFGNKVKVATFGRPNNFASLQNNELALQIIVKHVLAHGIETIFVPDVLRATGRIADANEFTKKISLGGVSVFADVSSDGVELPPRSAFFIASADCPTLVLRCPSGRVVATHAGRDCLFDKYRFIGGITRAHESAVFSAMKRLNGDAKEAHASIFCGIGAEYFTHPINHPECGYANEKLIQYICKRWGRQCFADAGENIVSGKLNLFELISAQFKEAGGNLNYIFNDKECTYSYLASSNEPLWWSHRRGNKERNGILVMRLS